MYEIYIDVFWRNNFCINLWVLLVVTAFFHERKKYILRKILVAAWFAAMNAMFLLVVGYTKWYAIVAIGAGGPGLIYFGMCPKQKRCFFRQIRIAVVCILVLGGMEYAATNVWRTYKIRLICAICAGMLVYYTFQRIQTEKLFCTIYLQNKGKRMRCMGFWDSGNTLREPQSGMPIHIVSHQVLTELGITKEDEIETITFTALGVANKELSIYEVEKFEIKEYTYEKVYVGDAGEQMLYGREYQVILNREM